MSTIEPNAETGAHALNMPMAENGTATQPYLDQKFDPSVGSQPVSHANGIAPTSELHSGPTSGTSAANTSEVAPAAAPVEQAAEVPSTTTTTIM